MSLKSGLLIIILGILITKIKVSSAKKYDWRFTNKYDKFSFPPSRHSNHFHKKYKDHNSYFSTGHYKNKPSRYPILDELSNRLDNKVDIIRLENLESTTSNPYDDWEFITPNVTSLNEKYSYKIDIEPVTVKSGDKLRHSAKYRLLKDDWSEPGDSAVELGSDKKGALHFSTSKPWEFEQRDIAFHGLGNSKDTNNDLPSYSPVTVKSYVTIPSKEELLKKSQAHSRFAGKPTREQIQERRRLAELERKESKEVEARKNIEKVREWQCQLPKAKIVRVQEIYPDSSKTYLPPCAILHRCSDDTGCCNDLKQVCKPKNITKIEIPFFITHLSKNSATKVEKLAFENHTECSCQTKTEEIIPEQRDSESYHSQKFIRPSTVDPFAVKSNCKCPSEYSVRYLSNGTCVCDCFDKQTDCLTLKKGKTYFLPADRLCIQESLCLPPFCEYGSYIREHGRCPKSKEKQYYPSYNRRFIT